MVRLQVFDSPDWLELDLFPDFALLADFSYYSIERLGELEMPISSQISLPNTETNRLRLGVANDASLKPTDLTARILVDGTAVYKYRLKIDSMITLGLNERIECTLIDPLKEAVEKLKDMDLSDLVTDGEYDEPFSTAGITAINNNVDDFVRIVYQDFNGFGDDDKRIFAFRPDTDFDAKDGVQQVVPALKVKQIFSKAFTEVGLNYDSKFFEGSSEIENFPVDDLYVQAPTRFFLDPDKSQPISGTWADERTDTVDFWSAVDNRPNVFGFSELYDANNQNQVHPTGLNWLKRNNIIAGQNASQHELFDIASLTTSNGVFNTNQMVFKKPARYSLSFSESVDPSLSLVRYVSAPPLGGINSAVKAWDIDDADDGIEGEIKINLVVSVNGSIKQATLATIDSANATWDGTNKQYNWPSTSLSVPTDFYIDVDAGDVVEMYITMQSEDGTVQFTSAQQYKTPMSDFGQNPSIGGFHLLFSLSGTSAIYKSLTHVNLSTNLIGFPQVGNIQNPVYDITFSPYEEFPVSSYSGSEYLDFKYNLSKVTDLSLWDVMTDIARRFNMSMVYDFPSDTVVVDNLLEEYIKPSSTEGIVYLFDNRSELKQNFGTPSVKSVSLLNASGSSITDEYRPATSPFTAENEVDTFGSLKLYLDDEGDREDSFQSRMLLANGSIYGERFEVFDNDIFKERVKYGIPNNTPLRSSEMGLRIGFLNGTTNVRIYEPVYEVVDNMVKMQYVLEAPNSNASAVMYEMTETSDAVSVGGDPETYSLRWDDSTDTFRSYFLFWKSFVDIVNDSPSLEAKLVIKASDLTTLDFRRRYDFGYGDVVLVSISGFDFSLDASKVNAKFLLM